MVQTWLQLHDLANKCYIDLSISFIQHKMVRRYMIPISVTATALFGASGGWKMYLVCFKPTSVSEENNISPLAKRQQ